MTAAVLGKLAGAGEGSKTDEMLRQLAHRISENRVVAGIHFPIDMVAGRLLGDALASYFLARADKDNQLKWTGGKFEIGSNESSGEFKATNEEGKVARFFGPGCERLHGERPRKSDLLVEMWREAAAEWERQPK
jgi:hypothetical protein